MLDRLWTDVPLHQCDSLFLLLLQWTIEDKPVKIDKWDPAAVKNALDDAAKKVSYGLFTFIS